MHKPVTNFKESCNSYAATRVLGWVQNPDRTHWCRLKDGMYREYIPVDQFYPMDIDTHAIRLIREVKNLSPDWYVQVEAQDTLFRCFAEEEGVRGFGFWRDPQFSVAVTVAILLASGMQRDQLTVKENKNATNRK